MIQTSVFFFVVVVDSIQLFQSICICICVHLKVLRLILIASNKKKLQRCCSLFERIYECGASEEHVHGAIDYHYHENDGGDYGK